MATTLTKFADIPCCPNLDTEPVCDAIDMRRRLLFPTQVRTESGQLVNVEVILHTRCVTANRGRHRQGLSG